MNLCDDNTSKELKALNSVNATQFNALDSISRQAAIDLIESIETERLKGNIELIYAPAIKGLRALPPAQLAPDQNGDLWITVPDIDDVKCIYVQEGKSKFCRIFYEEKEQPEIIHCKDCKYFKQVFAPNDNDGLCGHWHSKCDARTSRKGYCSHAERKQNDTERC